MAYIIINKFNMGRAKVVSKPFNYMWDAVDHLAELQCNYQKNGLCCKTIDDETFICFPNGTPSFFRVVEEQE